MAFAIPKIQYKNLDTTGDITSGSSTINDIADTSDLEVGMFVRATGVPTGALIGSIGANSVVLAASVQATATTNNVALAFGYEIEFDYPPIEVEGRNLETKATTSDSLSGIKQVSVNYVEEIRKFKFSFLSPTIFALVDTFISTHAIQGESFRYYANKTLTPYTSYELDSLKYSPKKIAPKGVDTYVWEVPLNFRRVL